MVGRKKHVHDILRMIVHACIPKVEAFEVGHRRALDIRGEFKRFAKTCKLREVVGDQGELVCYCEVLDFRWCRLLRGFRALIRFLRAVKDD